MTGSQTFERLSSKVVDEHRQIHFYFDQIEQTLGRLGDAEDDVEPIRRLAAQLQGLKERLVEHHQSEEGSAFLAVLEALPARRVEVNRLTNQHSKILEILEMARIHAENCEPAEAPALCEDLRRFLGMFREHELAEERLLEEALAQNDEAAAD